MNELFKTILGTVKGANNEGSSKRIAAAYFTIVILSTLTGVYSYGYYLACQTTEPTKVHLIIVDMYIYVISAYLLSIWAFFGLATIEMVRSLIATVRGNNPSPTEPKPENNA
jgi:hypothetical protein